MFTLFFFFFFLKKYLFYKKDKQQNNERVAQLLMSTTRIPTRSEVRVNGERVIGSDYQQQSIIDINSNQRRTHQLSCEEENDQTTRKQLESEIIETFSTFCWDVVQLRAARQLTKLKKLTRRVELLLKSKSQAVDQTEAWRTSVKLLRKIELISILLEVIDSQNSPKPSQEALLIKEVLATRKHAEEVQEKLLNFLVTTRSKSA